jgi:hypothetical protein
VNWLRIEIINQIGQNIFPRKLNVHKNSQEVYAHLHFLWLLHLCEFLGNQIKLKIKKPKNVG